MTSTLRSIKEELTSKNIQWEHLPKVETTCPDCDRQLHEQPTRYGPVLYCKCGYEWYDGDGGRVKAYLASEIAIQAATGSQPIHGGGSIWWGFVVIGVLTVVLGLVGPYNRGQMGLLVYNGLFMLVVGVWSLYRMGELEITALTGGRAE